MAQQAVRRIRRSAGKNTALWRGVLVSVAVTAAAVVIFAVIIGFADLGDGLIRVINQLIKIGAIFAGVRAVVSRGDENGIRRGAAIGLIYMGIGVLIYALCTGQKLTVMGYLIDLIMGVAAGGLSGMLVSLAKRRGE